jgi:hypothetical protein
VDTDCSLVKNRGHKERWFSSPILFDQLLACGTKAVGTIMPNRKITKQPFSKKLYKREKIMMHRDHLMAIKWRGLP